MVADSDRLKIKDILARLVRVYRLPPRRRAGAVDVLIGTILSQNTSASNSSGGYRRLRRRFCSWGRLADAQPGQIERCIRACGLSRLKAPRIRNILRRIRDERGRITLQFLRHLPPEQAGEYLMRFDGVGAKTAGCVLLFAFGMPIFPVDTHIRRIAGRLGLVPPGTSANAVQEDLTPRIAPRDRYAMHVLLIAHGRAVCHARNPKCPSCILLDICPCGRRRPRGSHKR